MIMLLYPKYYTTHEGGLWYIWPEKRPISSWIIDARAMQLERRWSKFWGGPLNRTTRWLIDTGNSPRFDTIQVFGYPVHSFLFEDGRRWDCFNGMQEADDNNLESVRWCKENLELCEDEGCPNAGIPHICITGVK